MSQKQTPSDFLKLIIGKPVVVKLNSGVDYRGGYELFQRDCNYRLFFSPLLRGN